MRIILLWPEQLSYDMVIWIHYTDITFICLYGEAKDILSLKSTEDQVVNSLRVVTDTSLDQKTKQQHRIRT